MEGYKYFYFIFNIFRRCYHDYYFFRSILALFSFSRRQRSQVGQSRVYLFPGVSEPLRHPSAREAFQHFSGSLC